MKQDIMSQQSITESPLLGSPLKKNWRIRALWILFAFLIISSLIIGGDSVSLILRGNKYNERNDPDVIESEVGVVAADDGRCSEVGVSMLRQGGHAVDAAVATALCLGVVNPVSSGIGGGAFMVVWSSLTLKSQAYDSRETAPLAASQDMYANNIDDKYSGGRSMGVPGEIAGLHEAWLGHGRLAWKTLFQPAIELARDGFVIAPYLGQAIASHTSLLLNDAGLQQVFAPNGKLLQTADKCYNKELARSLEAIAEHGPQAFYSGSVGENLVKDVREAGGILTEDDLNTFKVDVMDAMSVNTMGYTIHGMPPPSSGTLGLSLVLNIFDSYKKPNAAKGDLGLHRLIEALKYMFAVRMSLGDPKFVNDKEYISEMLSPSYAKQIRESIQDNTTFGPDHYMYRWSQLRDHGTSHFCIVDADRNAVSMTTSVNYPFGAGVLSPSTGIVLNNEMGDFSSPTEISTDMLPPAPANFIKPNKRPLSSMTPIIVTKKNQVASVLGGSGGMNIIPAVTQVLLNHFVAGMDPLAAVQSPRVYHRLIPNLVNYENWTVIDGEHIELGGEKIAFLRARGHRLESMTGGAMVQLIVQNLQNPVDLGRKYGKSPENSPIIRGTLTAVSDPRKDGKPSAV